MAITVADLVTQLGEVTDQTAIVQINGNQMTSVLINEASQYAPGGSPSFTTTVELS